jgi:site-specific recombinase XerC
MELRVYCPDFVPEEKPARRKRLPQFLRWPDALRVLAWCEAEIARRAGRKRQAGAIIDERIIRIGLYLGLRCAEIQALDVEDVDLPNRSVLVRLGKGSKDRYVPIPEKLVPCLEATIGGRTSGILIVGRGGLRVAGRTIRWRVARAARLAGLALKIHPHTLRHTYATHYIETGGKIHHLQRILGHAALATTAIYLDVDTSQFLADVNRM